MYIDGILITLHIIIWTSIELNAIVAISLSSHNFLPIDSHGSHGADILTVYKVHLAVILIWQFGGFGFA